MKSTYVVWGVTCGIWLGLASPAAADTVVTTYVTHVQEERASTRWTLTEWLRIKERMRLMDLWLAMFSNPKKDHFSPELNLSYSIAKGNLALTAPGQGAGPGEAVTGTEMRAQLWLTNLVSGLVGVRTLNIDIGLEGFAKSLDGFHQQTTATDPAASPVTDDALGAKRLAYAAALRLFGKSTQDTSLILKYGAYKQTSAIPALGDPSLGKDRQGVQAGGELSVYFCNWLGAEGNYMAMGDDRRVVGADDVQGSYYDYSGFIEVSLLRLMVGRYHEDWRLRGTNGWTKTGESGFLGGVKLQF